MYRPSGVFSFDPVIHSFMIPSVESFIPETPNYYKRVVFVPVDHLAHAFDISSFPGWIVGCKLCGLWEGQGLALLIGHTFWNGLGTCHCIVESMAFQVGFIDNVKAKLISNVV